MTKLQFFGALAFAGVLGLTLPEFYVTILNYIGLYGLVALGIVLLTGVIGVTSFGQAAFVGLSAYLSAVAAMKFAIPPLACLAICIVVTVAVAAIIGLLTLSLSGHYLPLGTIAWGLSAYYALGNIEAFGGHTGLDNIPPLTIGGLQFQTSREMFGLIWLITICASAAVSNMLDSRSGRAMRAIKTSRETAESFGVDTTRLRLVAFLYAAVLAAISGWLYTFMLRFLNPSPFSLTMGIEYLFMAVVGGAGQVWGALLGAGVITFLKEWLQDALPRLFGQTGNFEIIVFGALVIAMIQLNDEDGLSSVIKRTLSNRFLKRASSKIVTGGKGLPKKDRTDAKGILLSVRRISKNFGGLKALNDVAFDVEARRIVGVIGPNGAGKSTLFNCVTSLTQVDAGSIWIGDVKTSDGKTRDVVKLGLARTFQHVQLIDRLTVLENVMLGGHTRSSRGSFAAALKLKTREEDLLRQDAFRQLERVGLAHLADVPALSLALGQQRLVEIARALCADPALLLLDEPAAGLRFAEKKELAELLKSLRSEGLSVLIVEHDMEFVMKLCDRLVVMNFGEKLMEGTPAEVRADQRVLEAYLGKDAA
jgi:branched-chain amino acid transport system permease protein